MADYGVAVGVSVGVSVGVLVVVAVGVLVGVKVTVGVKVMVGVNVTVGVNVCVGVGVIVAVAGSELWRVMRGFTHSAKSSLEEPFAKTVRMNFTFSPRNALRSTLTG